MLAERASQSGRERIAVQCGDDLQAKQSVKLTAEIGFAPQDLGKLSSGSRFEPGAPLYNKNLISEAEAVFARLD